MVFVKAQKGDSNDTLIRKFSRKIMEADLMKQIRDMQFHKTPSEIRKEKRKGKKRRHT